MLTEEQRQTVIDLYNECHNMETIHYKTNFARDTIRNILIKEGLYCRRQAGSLEKYDFNEVLEYYKTHSCLESAKHFNCQVSSFSPYFYRHGVSKPKIQNTFYKVVDKEELKEWYINHTITECAEHFNVKSHIIEMAVCKLDIHKNRKAYGENRKKNVFTPKNFLNTQREMVLYLAEKYSGEDIATLLNKTPARISQIINSKGVNEC